MKNEGQELRRGLKRRHVLMFAVGGSIGSGIFQGSSTAISIAGPAVIISYLLGGFLLYFVMQSLAKMTVYNKDARTFRELIEESLGPFTGYSVGWFYWVSLILVMAAEVSAAAMFLQYWFSHVPLWVLSLLVSILITLLNLFQVKIYGEVEYWLSAIKIAVLILFVIVGGVLLFTGYHNQSPVGFSNLISHHGFFPNGVSGIVASMLVVIFSFGGSEAIGTTLAETENPDKVIPRATRNVTFRILIFYILPILTILCLTPWNQLESNESPFVKVFNIIGVPYVGAVMNFVLLTAVISAANTGMYAASRLLYTQSLEGNAPAYFGQLTKKNVPLKSIIFSTSLLYIGVIVAFFAKGKTFGYLMTLPGYAVLVVWILLIASYIKIRNKQNLGKKQSLKNFPFVSWLSLLCLICILIGIIITSPVIGTLFCVFLTFIIFLSYILSLKRKSANSFEV
jgi:AAT family amino acid transporter